MVLLIRQQARSGLKSLPVLHSNMVLLIPEQSLKSLEDTVFTFQYGSINTDIDWGNKEVIIYFTFQYGSINTLLCSRQVP